MKYLLLLLIATNVFAVMSAGEARRKANKERITKEKACIEGFKDEIQEDINEAIEIDNNSTITSCYTCPHGLYAIVNKLEKLKYTVNIHDCDDKRKRLYISW